MSAISLKSITGITSITTPAGVDNQLTLHTNDTTERLRIKSDGDVLIGTQTAASKLTVDTGGNATADYISVTSGGTGRLKLGYVFTGGPSNDHFAEILTDTNGDLDIATRGNNSSQIKLFTSTGSGSEERLRIDSSGRIGVNYTPGSGDGIFNVKVDGTNVLHIGHGTNKDNYFTCGASGMQVFRSAGTERLRITSGGDVSIGGRSAALANYADGSTTTTKLAVVDNVGGSGYHEVAHFTAGTDSNDTGAIVRITHKLNDRGLYIKAGRGTGDQAKAIFGLRTSSPTESDVMTFIQGGKVGINNTAPTAKLDIVEATSTTAVKIKSGTSTNQNASLTFSNDNGGGLMHLGVFGSSASTYGSNEATDGFISAMQQLSINSQNASGEIRFGVGVPPETKLRITSTGHVRQVWGNELFFGTYYSSEYYMGFTYGTNARELYIDNRSNDTRADIVFRTKEGGAPEERLRIDSGGGVRINNTRTTATKLHVVGGTASGTAYDAAVFAGGQNSTQGSGARIWLTGCENDPTARGTVIEGVMTDNQNAHALIFKTSAAAASPSERLRINSNGGLKLSNTSGGNLFEYGGSTEKPNAAININRYGNGYADIRLSSNYGASLRLAGAADNTDEFNITQDNLKVAYITNEADKAINFSAGGTQVGKFNGSEGLFQVSGDITAGHHHGNGMYGLLAKRKFQGGDALGGYAIRYASGYESPWIIGYNAGASYDNQITFGSMTTSDRNLATGVTKRMVIDMETGKVGVNDTTNGWAEKLQVTGDYNSQYAIAAKIGQSSGTLMRFGTTSGVCGSITGNGTNSAYNTSSDYRLKENDVRITDGISRVKQLRPIKFNWKTDPSTTQDGFFAHEVSPVVPESVTGEKDASIDEIGAGYQMIDHSKLVPLLTAALQEAISEIETLKTKVTALEGS